MTVIDLGAFGGQLHWKSLSPGGGGVVAVDGVDGSGKSTLSRGLCDLLVRKGLRAQTVDLMSPWVRHHPQFALLSDDLENVRSGRADITALCAMCVGDRLASWRTKYSSYVAAGGWLVVDRYHLTPMADMLTFGAGRDDQNMVRLLLELLPRPTFAFFTDTPAEMTITRVRARPDESARPERLELTAQLIVTFRALAEVHGCSPIDCSGSASKALADAEDALVGAGIGS